MGLPVGAGEDEAAVHPLRAGVLFLGGLPVAVSAE